MNNNGFYYQDTIKQDIDKLTREVQMYTWEQAENIILDQAEIIERLLFSDVAMNILYYSMGKRFDKIFELRRKLRSKQHMLYNFASRMHNEWCKVFKK